MHQEPLPQYLLSMTDAAIQTLLFDRRKKLKDRCIILGHHYQKDDVIIHADFVGDSLKLAKAATQYPDKQNIVFCGVHFMAETADILTSDKQRVALPELDAGCDMADMAKPADIEKAWHEVNALGIEHVIPVTYVNSSAAVKAFVGDHDGIVCTSGNADQIVRWALNRGQHVLFLPDQHLGRNVSKNVGLDPERDMLLWDPTKSLGGHNAENVKSSRVWLWKGHCPVHEEFTVAEIEDIRSRHPKMKIIVHPECSMAVCDLADAVGSTEKIIDTITSSPPGSEWAVGTEKNLVERLAKNLRDRTIVSLSPTPSVCSTMNKVTARHLAWILDELYQKNILRNQIKVEPAISASAKKALIRMMELS